MALCVNACATATGLYDPLEECGRYCGENGIWFHVDGAHGASALISPRERGLMRGVNLADSLVWDAHKMLHTSALCTALLVRDQRTLMNAFRQDASYVLHSHPDPPGPDLLPRSIECTKGQIGLKAFMNLAVYGEAGLASVLEDLFSSARRFAEVIRGNGAFEVPFEPESNIVCFRYRSGDDDRQEWIRNRLVEDGRFYISSAVVAGRRYLRLTIMNPRTDETAIRSLLALIEVLSYAGA